MFTRLNTNEGVRGDEAMSRRVDDAIQTAHRRLTALRRPRRRWLCASVGAAARAL